MARVLIADDEPDILGAITSELEVEGHEVVGVSDGDEVVGAEVRSTVFRSCSRTTSILRTG